MELIIVVVAILFAYGLGRVHGRRAIGRQMRGFFNWLK